jgi:hypothetical protein
VIAELLNCLSERLSDRALFRGKLPFNDGAGRVTVFGEDGCSAETDKAAWNIKKDISTVRIKAVFVKTIPPPDSNNRPP